MAEHAVEHDADTVLLGGAAQAGEILLAAQKWVDAAVIRCIVAVVGMGFKDGIEVKAGDAQRLQIGELLPDAFQVPAKKVGIGDLPFAVGTPLGLSTPVLPQGAPGGQILMRLAGLCKPVGKDLVEDSPCHPGGSLVIRVVSGQLPEFPVPKLALSSPVPVDFFQAPGRIALE